MNCANGVQSQASKYLPKDGDIITLGCETFIVTGCFEHGEDSHTGDMLFSFKLERMPDFDDSELYYIRN